MSYAGVYGDDETCRHGSYWRSCGSCWRIGPRASDAQIAESFEKSRQDRDRAEAERAQLRNLYDVLSSAEKKVAEALWQEAGLGHIDLRAAVRELVDSSWAIGRARSICRQAKIAVNAVNRP